jgi:hypothetical protein
MEEKGEVVIVIMSGGLKVETFPITTKKHGLLYQSYFMTIAGET